MSLFVIQHQHPEESCPATNPEMGAMLLQHVQPDSARRYGVNIHGEGVIDGGHTFFLIVDAEDRTNVDEYMQPFAMVGSVNVMPASSCETVVSRAGC